MEKKDPVPSSPLKKILLEFVHKKFERGLDENMKVPKFTG